MFELTAYDVILRLLLACLISGLIGWEREFYSRPAGMRTHMLVCVGATVIALIQMQIMVSTIAFAIEYPDYSGLLRADPARLICQVVSGVGFLGAGTIVITKSSIRGLTTAASLWATAGLGLAIGMGYYQIAVSSAIIILIILVLLKRILHLPGMTKIEVSYHHRQETTKFIQAYFEEKHIRVRDTNFSVGMLNQETRIYTTTFTIELPKGTTYVDIAEGLSTEHNITKIRLMSL